MADKKLEWRDVKGYEGYYMVSNDGQVKGLERKVRSRFKTRTVGEYILKPEISNVGYYRVRLSKNYKTRAYSVHRLVAEAFINNHENLREVNHKDLNKINNSVDNLEWISRLQNAQHASINGAYDICRKKGLDKHTSKKCVNTITGEFYNYSQAANIAGWSVSHFCLMINGVRKNVTSFAKV